MISAVARSTPSLEAQSFHVLRFGDAEVMRSIDTVLNTSVSFLAVPVGGDGEAVISPTADQPGGPTSNSSPRAGGESAER